MALESSLINMLLELFALFVLYGLLTHIIDYRILKNIYLRSRKWDLNISCGKTDGGGVNADIVKRNVNKFVLIKNIYKLPFKTKQFKNVFCSHTIEHVGDPERFYKELKRVGKNVILIIPPIWDLAGVLDFYEHKWQFITFKTKHINYLPNRIRLPYSWLKESPNK